VLAALDDGDGGDEQPEDNHGKSSLTELDWIWPRSPPAVWQGCVSARVVDSGEEGQQREPIFVSSGGGSSIGKFNKWNDDA